MKRNARTSSAAVNRAHREVLRLRKVRQLSAFFGRGLWQGNLSEMREDSRGPSSRMRR
jgi:hypothetical protein